MSSHEAIVPSSRSGALASLAPGTLAFIAAFVVPFAIFVVYSFLTAGTFSADPPLTLDAYRGVVESPLLGTWVLNSIRVGVPVAAVTLAIAIPVAYWLRYAAGRLQVPVLFLFTATIFASYLVRIYAWRTLLGEHGVLNDALTTLGLIDHPLGFLLFSRFAVVLGMVHVLLPIAVLVMLSAFRPLTGGYLEAARDLGAGPAMVWRRVILPAIAGPASTLFLLVFLIASSDWITPLLLGGGKNTMLGQEVQVSFISVGDYPSGAALSLLMLSVFALLYLVLAGVLRRSGLNRLEWTDATPGAPRSSLWTACVTVAALVFLYVPLALVVLFSFHRTAALSFPFDGFSLRWYRAFFDDPTAMDALGNSVIVALAVTVVTTVLGTLTAVGLMRLGRRWRGGLTALFLLPISVPPLFIGLSLLTYFVRAEVPLSLFTVVVGHLVQTVPLFLVICLVTLSRLDPTLDETAADLGANAWTRFRRVTLPQIWPSIAAGASLAFALSFDEFAVTVFTIGQENTLPMFIYGRLRQTIDPLINAVSSLLMAFMLLLFAVAFVTTWVHERRRSRSMADALAGGQP